MEQVAYYLWIVAFILLILLSIIFNKKSSFVQFNLKKIFSSIYDNNKENRKIFFMSIGGKIGVGNIISVAFAIYITGPGSIFWMWVISLITASIVYYETYFGYKYRQNINNKYVSGPNYYIKYGLSNNKLSIIYATVTILAYSIGFSAIQSNTISKSIHIPSIIIGLFLMIITFLIIKKGFNKILEISSKIVPFMLILYLLVSLYIVLKNVNIIHLIFEKIIYDAFNFKSIIGGLLPLLITGAQRAIFSNEVGIGTSSFTSCLFENNVEKTAYLQILSIYITSIFISTLTAIIILSSNYELLNYQSINGIEIAQHAFIYHLGKLGNIILSITIFLFAYSTILTCYYYGESSLIFLKKNKLIPILKIILPIILFISSIISSHIIWNFIDILTALMCIINVYSLYKLYKK